MSWDEEKFWEEQAARDEKLRAAAERRRRAAEMMRRNNPRGEPVGNCTGRCKFCGSTNLWDDNLAYGCNDCGALLGSNF